MSTDLTDTNKEYLKNIIATLKPVEQNTDITTELHRRVDDAIDYINTLSVTLNEENKRSIEEKQTTLIDKQLSELMIMFIYLDSNVCIEKYKLDSNKNTIRLTLRLMILLHIFCIFNKTYIQKGGRCTRRRTHTKTKTRRRTRTKRR